MKKIMILANKYPNEVEPNVCVFIQQLVWSFADLGYQCVVVAPAPIDSAYWRLPKIEEEITENGNVVKIYHPKYVSLGQSGVFLKKYRVKLTTLFLNVLFIL